MEVGDRQTIASGYEALGFTALAIRDNAAAIAALSQAALIWEDLGSRGRHAHAIACLGIAHLRTGDVATARPLLRDACLGAKDAQLYVGIWALEGTADRLGTTGRAAARRSVGPPLTRRGPHRWTARSRWRGISSRLRASVRRRPFRRPPTKPPERWVGQCRSGTRSTMRSGHLMGRPPILWRSRLCPCSPGSSRPDATRARGAGAPCGWALRRRDRGGALHQQEDRSCSRRNIKGKLDAGSRVEIVRIALRSGLVDAEPDCASPGVHR